MIRCTRGSTAEISCAPLVSSNTVRSASASIVIKGRTFFCSKWLAARDLDQRTIVSQDRLHDFA